MANPTTESISTAPVVELAADAGRPVEEGIAICLSGGGYRAMLFHTGVFWRLVEAGYLGSKQLKRVSSVSGGSITSAMLGLKWSNLELGTTQAVNNYVHEVVEPIRRLAGKSLAEQSFSGVFKLIGNIILPGSINSHLADSYAEHLFGDASIKALPSDPRFVINASNLQSGALWRFMSPYMRDWRVGENTHTEKVSIARAVAASSAFPPFLAPATFKFHESDFTPNSGGGGDDNLQRPPFTTEVQLADGGVYDNLGLETAYKRYRTLLVSDAGAPFKPDGDVPRNWAGLSYRVLDVIDNQVRSLRKRLLLKALVDKDRTGAFWSIGQDIGIYAARSALPCPFSSTKKLASIDTDLASKDSQTQERLINWGYALCDAAVRTWFDSALAQPENFPYPTSGV